MSLFRPLIYQKSIFDINYDVLKKKKINVLIFDLDNTLVKIDEKLPCHAIKELINKLSKTFKIIIASNNISKRVKKVAEHLNCMYYANLRKPSMKLKKLLEKDAIKLKEVCLIGDQVMTDVYLGNKVGILTILVDPLGEKDLKITFFNRLAEKIIRKRINLKKGEYYESEIL